MFDQIKSQVIGVLLPDYQKTIHNITSLAACEVPTSEFIVKLAKMLLPDKAVSIGEPQE